MRTRLPIIAALLAGLVMGAAGILLLCSAGLCGDEADRVAEVPATATVVSAVAPTVEASPALSPTNTPEPTPEVPATSTFSPFGAGGENVEASPTPGRGRAHWWNRPIEKRPIIGLGFVSDSSVDEYQADNPRGGDYKETTLNWVELLARERGINVGPWGDREPPRRSGYEYNWARSGASSTTMIWEGQHTGVAEQVRAGLLSHVFIQIGLNDFYHHDVGMKVYTGELAGEDLEHFINQIVGNVETAVQTIKAAGDCEIILSALKDWLTLGIVIGAEDVFSDPEGWQRLIDAFEAVNQGFEALAEREGLVYFDFNVAIQEELAERWDPADDRFLIVGGERIDRSTRGNEPHHVLVDDEYVHPGTVFSGLLANLFIDLVNDAFDAGISRFTDEEILQIAGIR